MIRQELRRHGSLVSVGIEVAAFAHQVVGDFFGGDDDMGDTSEGDLVDGAVLRGPLGEFEPGVVRGELGEVAEEGEAWRGDVSVTKKIAAPAPG